jgi:hypothetical protein
MRSYELTVLIYIIYTVGATAQWRCGCWRKWVAGRQCFLSKGFTWHSRVLWSSLPSALYLQCAAAALPAAAAARSSVELAGA